MEYIELKENGLFEKYTIKNILNAESVNDTNTKIKCDLIIDKGCLEEAINYCCDKDDVVEFSRNLYKYLIDKGYKVFDKEKANKEKKILEYEEASKNVREKRDMLLLQADRMVERYRSQQVLGITPKDDIKILEKYRQDLRDVPQQKGFPFSVEFPIMLNN